MVHLLKCEIDLRGYCFYHRNSKLIKRKWISWAWTHPTVYGVLKLKLNNNKTLPWHLVMCNKFKSMVKYKIYFSFVSVVVTWDYIVMYEYYYCCYINYRHWQIYRTKIKATTKLERSNHTYSACQARYIWTKNSENLNEKLTYAEPSGAVRMIKRI